MVRDLVKAAASEAGMAEKRAEQARGVLLDALHALEPSDYKSLLMAIEVVRAARQRNSEVRAEGWRPQVGEWAKLISDLPTLALKALAGCSAGTSQGWWSGTGSEDAWTLTYPVVVTEDRYSGAFSGGQWIAAARVDAVRFDQMETVMSLDEQEAQVFWRSPPSWIAAGDSPDEAVDALRAGYTL